MSPRGCNPLQPLFITVKYILACILHKCSKGFFKPPALPCEPAIFFPSHFPTQHYHIWAPVLLRKKLMFSYGKNWDPISTIISKVSGNLAYISKVTGAVFTWGPARRPDRGLNLSFHFGFFLNQKWTFLVVEFNICTTLSDRNKWMWLFRVWWFNLRSWHLSVYQEETFEELIEAKRGGKLVYRDLTMRRSEQHSCKHY